MRRYFAHFDKVLDLSKDIGFSANVTSAVFDTKLSKWQVATEDGRTATCTYFICVTGSSFKRHYPDFKNLGSYKGSLHHSAFWPKDLDTSGKRIVIIGSGATGVQCVQEMAKTASHLTVYIRTVSLALPMGQRKLTKEEQDQNKSIYKSIFNLARQSNTGLAYDGIAGVVADATTEEREKFWEELWNRGGFNFQVSNYRDYLTNMESNNLMCDFWARKTRERFKNPDKRAFLAPETPPYQIGTKRSSLEQDYYECLDKDNVDIVNLKANPIREFTERGIICDDGTEREFEIVVLATGYDAMTGSLTNMGVRGKDDKDIKERWKDVVFTHLGMFTGGCPNMFMVYGPQGKTSDQNIEFVKRANIHLVPTAFTNGPIFVEMQVDFLADFLTKIRAEGIKTFEPQRQAAEKWRQDIQDDNDKTLFPLTDSWYMGANIPGKKREQLNYIRGIQNYDKACRESLEHSQGFDFVCAEGRTGKTEG